MPFTPAHSVAVLPLARKPLVLSALVIGSFAPDFEYFIYLAPLRRMGHTSFGLLAFCVPAGLVVFWIWHNLLKGALVELLPDSHYRKLKPFCEPVVFASLRYFLMVCLSILIGAVTHITWDTFTHANSWGVRTFPFLNLVLMDTEYGVIRLYKALQHGCSLFGMLFLVLLYVRWFRTADEQSDSSGSRLSVSFRMKSVMLIIIVAGFLALIAGIMATESRGAEEPVLFGVLSYSSLLSFLGTGGIACISFVVMGFFLYSIWARFTFLKSNRSSLL